MSKSSGTRGVPHHVRRRIRRYLLTHYGDGVTAPCAVCGTPLTRDTLTVGHYPIPACLGGGWTEDNVRPECSPCNHEDGIRISREYGHLTPRERAWARAKLLERASEMARR